MLSTQEAEQTAAEVTEQQARIGRLARAVYQGGGSLGNVSMLLDAQSPSDFAERLVALQTVVSSQRSVLADLETVQQSFGDRTDDLEQVRDELAAADEQAQRDLRAVAAARRAGARGRGPGRRPGRRGARPRSPPRRPHRRRTTPPTRTRVGESSQLQAELAAQARRDLGPAAGRDGCDRPGPPRHPRPGRCAVAITSPFGMRVHPVTGVYKLHTGADIGAACGTPIRVALDGVGRPGRLEQRLRLAHRRLARRRRRCPAHHDVQPPDRSSGSRSATGSRPGR